MIFHPFLSPATGCAAYLLGCAGRGVCAIVDPRDEEVDAYVEFAGARGLAVKLVIDTHVHADHVSGGRRLADRTGAASALGPGAAAQVPHETLVDGEEREVGNVLVRVLHTPGHTPESVCLLVTDRRRGPEPWFLLTGDTLLVGSVGRPDLPGDAARDAGIMWDSLQRITSLPDALEIYPAHFAGSACGTGLSGKPMSTLGFERRVNPLLALDRPSFVDRLTATGAAAPAIPGMAETLRRNRGLADA